MRETGKMRRKAEGMEILEMSWEWEREPSDARLRAEFLRVDKDRREHYWAMGIAGLSEEECGYGLDALWRSLRTRVMNRGLCS